MLGKWPLGATLLQRPCETASLGNRPGHAARRYLSGRNYVIIHGITGIKLDSRSVAIDVGFGYFMVGYSPLFSVILTSFPAGFLRLGLILSRILGFLNNLE